MERLHTAVVATGARSIDLTPPVFDPLPIAANVLPAGLDAYPHPSPATTTCSPATPLGCSTNAAAAGRSDRPPRPHDRRHRRPPPDRPQFTLSKDGVHPDVFGHAVMARAVLEARQLRPDDGDLLNQLATHPDGALLKLIRERRKLRANAAAPPPARTPVPAGLPLAEAEAQAAVLTAEIRALK